MNKYIPSKCAGGWEPFDIPFYVESAKKIWGILNLDDDTSALSRNVRKGKSAPTALEGGG